MDFERKEFSSGTAFRFKSGSGGVCVLAHYAGPKKARLEVWDFASAITFVGKSDDENRESPELKAARNRYGYSFIRNALRTVKMQMPAVRDWLIYPKTRANTERRRKMWQRA